MLELVEEALDEAPMLVKLGIEKRRRAPIGLWSDNGWL